MQVILHIGYPKTGSSAIQSHLSSNRGWLHRQGIYIPTTGYAAGAGHAFLLGQFLGGSVQPQEYDPQQLQLLQDELDAAEKAGFERALLSWEGFALVNDDSLSSLSNHLARYRTTLLTYVREQGELHQSAVLQNMGRLRLVGSADPLASAAPASLPDHYDFHLALCRWRDAFNGKLAIKTRIFDRQRLTDGNVVLDFLQWLEAPANTGFCLQQQPVNTSLDVRSASLLHTVFTNKQSRARLLLLSQALARVINEYGAGSRYFLDSHARETIWARYEASNRRLFQAFAPENALPQESGFPGVFQPADDGRCVSDVEFHRRLRQALNNPGIPRWEGSVLAGFLLISMASAPNKGWGKIDREGVWSSGSESTLNFYLPELHLEQGPSMLVLKVAGQYAGGNTVTYISVGKQSMSMDLRQGEISIEIDDQVRASGVEITLEHEAPVLASPSTDHRKEDGAAFKLQFLSYNFVWDNAEMAR